MRRAQLAGVSALAAVVGIIAIYLVAGGGANDGAGGGSVGGDETAGNIAPTAPAMSVPQNPQALLVREGDAAEATGRVIARPGQPVKLCAPISDLALRPDGPDCHTWVEVRGVNLDALDRRDVTAGVVSGHAWLRGTWASGVLTVTAQAVPGPATPLLPPPARVPPCPAPPAGWSSSTFGDGPALHDYIAQRPDRFAAPWVAYPNGVPADGSTDIAIVSVLVVEVITGDVEQARADLAKVYGGNLCVVRAAPDVRSSAEVDRNNATALSLTEPILNDRRNRAYSAGIEPSGLARLEFMILDQRLYDTLEDLGFDRFQLDPMLRPGTP